MAAGGARVRCERGSVRTAALPERQWVGDALRDETTGGVLLLAAATIALIWANSPWADTYFALASVVVGPAALHLDLPLSVGPPTVCWRSSSSSRALSCATSSRSAPVQPAQGGGPDRRGARRDAGPRASLLDHQHRHGRGQPGGWGIPMATDIAFALAVLAVVGRSLPVALRAFLLSLAVVDDLGAIAVIAIFYSHGFDPAALAASVALLALYGVLQWRRVKGWPIYLAIAVAAWVFMHASGVHATVAGVAAGLLTW